MTPLSQAVSASPVLAAGADVNRPRSYDGQIAVEALSSRLMGSRAGCEGEEAVPFSNEEMARVC